MENNATFAEDLQFSHEESQKGYWLEAYQNYFGDKDIIVEMVIPMGGSPDQGIDKILTMSNGRQFSVDEKIHKAKEGMAPDTSIFLEYRNLWDNGYETKGWANCPVKAACCDYVAYFKESLGVVYMLPTDEIQLLLKDFEDRGVSFGNSVVATTQFGGRTCYTYSWLVPVELLFQRINFRQQTVITKT